MPQRHGGNPQQVTQQDTSDAKMAEQDDGILVGLLRPVVFPLPAVAVAGEQLVQPVPYPLGFLAQEQITTKAGVRYTQITAADVTELIRKQDQLKAENAKLAEVNERLRLLLVQMPEIIREEETLAMKLRVHDDIGHSILAARRVLLQHTDLTEIRANAALWEQSISVLYRSSQITAQSEPLETAKKRAEELGVSVLLTGNEPQRQWIRALIALAICECAANCVRHADGTELYVFFLQKPDCTEVSLTNNGAVPKEKITEGGGLSMLRQRIEEAGGKMEVWSSPRFQLMLSLPEQEEAVHESDDR